MKTKKILQKLCRWLQKRLVAALDDLAAELPDTPDAPEAETTPESPPQSSETPVAPEQTADPTPAPAPAPALVFSFGGVKASPKEDSSCRISGLRMSRDGMSFHWDTGIPGSWKRGDTGKGPMVLACAFYWDAARSAWVGGKFDWIDESRSSRSFENIHDGYGGWDAAAFFAAARRAFCVMSADGKLRSNLLETT